MRSLKEIVAANAEAERQGVMQPGEAVGTTGYRPPGELHPSACKPCVERVEGRAAEGGTTGHSAAQGGLRGHSIGADYPFSVAGGFEPGDFGALHSVWTVVNHLTGERFDTFRGGNACKRAHTEASRLAAAWREGQDGTGVDKS